MERELEHLRYLLSKAQESMDKGVWDMAMMYFYRAGGAWDILESLRRGGAALTPEQVTEIKQLGGAIKEGAQELIRIAGNGKAEVSLGKKGAKRDAVPALNEFISDLSKGGA